MKPNPKHPYPIHEQEGDFYPKYENISLPEELRGKVANYKENIYESPIATSAGNVHFNYQTKNYFAHSRVEDMADGETRRVIESQSDLFQKGRLEEEKQFNSFEEALAEARSRGSDKLKNSKEGEEQAQKLAKEWWAEEQQLSKLEPYRNTWHERIVREEVKKAAKDGKTKLQFPTGETAMKIEGLGGVNTRWTMDSVQGYGETTALRNVELERGLKVNDGNSDWVITDVLGDGKFKAVPKDRWEMPVGKQSDTDDYFATQVMKNEDIARNSETFDISGTVDKENPIYKFYEKEMGKYLKNKFGAQLVTDAQDVTWYEIPIDKKMARLPVEAFALAPLAMPKPEQNEKR